MSEKFLYEKIDSLREAGYTKDLPNVINRGLSTNIVLREYQIEAFSNFVTYFENDKLKKNKQIHNLFHMATGSGKTVIMAGLILYLYTKGYRKFLFFVNQRNILEKTIDNFINLNSNKYLFNNVISYLGRQIQIKKVNNFSGNNFDDIEIVFTTTQKLHMDLNAPKEDSLTDEDFENNKVVFISDESHHINTLTKKPTKEEVIAMSSWEYSVMRALSGNKDSIMLEFTATCDLKDPNVLSKYRDKIIFNYPLISFNESGYTKDFKNFATDTELWPRALMAFVLSEYRRFLFAELKLNIKPVIMLKSQKIVESESFYSECFKNLSTLSSDEILNLKAVDIDILTEAIKYFENRDGNLDVLTNSIKNSFTKDNSIIMNGASDNNKEKQLLVNSLEDTDNHIRLVFAVDMLNEGWDVLNLFDIVRLYDTRQSSGKAGKIGSYTIREAQLIGRGARYCPFIVDDVDYKYKRKYDLDITNKYRILETLFFHSKNDSRYISELKQALIETGLQPENPIILEYTLKDDFKASVFYKQGLVYANKRLLKDNSENVSIIPSIRNKTYRYTVLSGKGRVINLFGDNDESNVVRQNKVKVFKFKDLDINILLGAIECFEELKFSILQKKYPNLNSTKQFLTDENFLGNCKVEISYFNDEVTGKDIFRAVKAALREVASYIISLKPEFKGSTMFEYKPIRDVLRDKKIYLEKVDSSGGKGVSQNDCSNKEYQLDLRNETWYVFNDNFGTSEEKLFLKYFKTSIAPKLDNKKLEYYVVRNERIPDLAIYSFEAGERFEPDFLLFIRKQISDKTITYQGYVEPKGDHLLEVDSWKEKFLLDIRESNSTQNNIVGEYHVFGLPFFNQANKLDEFETAIDNWLSQI